MARSALRTLVLSSALALSLSAGALTAAPEPSPVPKRWQLDAAFSPLRVATVEVPNVGPRAFYYLTYKVANNTGQDLLFAGSFELATADGKVYRSGRNVPAEVTAELIARQSNPLLQDQIAILGNLLQGPENAREGLVVWPAEDLSPGTLTVYAAGFSGETAIVQAPRSAQPAADAAKPAETAKPAVAETKDPAGEQKKLDGAAPAADSGRVTLRKTKMLRYNLGGELIGLRDKPIDATEARWIMR
ncbi:MAG: hypothetical protein ACK51N_02410 [bacterium]|jgi:hypothetical protein|nr:hypothetical protein [Phycisphaerales bacterium]MCE2653558.1 hypothetical protein [Planctomycetaceae bacterium]